MAAPAPLRSSDHPINDEHSDGPAMLFAGTGARRGRDIPVVDFDVLVNGAADQRSQAVRDLGRACQDWGFFMVINHGVPETLREAVVDAYKELFSLPREEKAEYMDAGQTDPIRMGTGFFYSVVDDARCCRDYVKMFAHPEFYCPAKPAKLREIAMEYSTCTRDLLLELAKAISESLGLDGGRISEALNLESCFQILVGNQYPPYAGPHGGAMGMSAHSDHGLLTLLFQNGVDGLQVEHNGQWLLAKPLPGALFVIVGDQLENLAVLPPPTLMAVDASKSALSFLSQGSEVSIQGAKPDDRSIEVTSIARWCPPPLINNSKQWKVQGRAPPRRGRRRADEDVFREPDRAVPGRRRRAGPGAGTGRPGPGVPGHQVQRLHGASAEQHAQRESSSGHCSRSA